MCAWKLPMAASGCGSGVVMRPLYTCPERIRPRRIAAAGAGSGTVSGASDPSTADHAEQHRDDRDDEQDVDQAAQRHRSEHADEPEDDEDDGDGVEHGFLRLLLLDAGVVDDALDAFDVSCDGHGAR